MILTIGHSTHTIEDLLSLLKKYGITAIADVRSIPFSRFQSQFNRESLATSLKSAGIEYVFVGDLIGGRSQYPDDYEDKRVVYSRLRENPNFEIGLARVISGSDSYRIALMCSEKEPLECHRSLLVGQALYEMGHEVSHIHGDGSLEMHSEALIRLLKLHKLDEPDLFRSEAEVLHDALLRQERKIAFVLDDSQRGLIGSGQFGTSEDGVDFL